MRIKLYKTGEIGKMGLVYSCTENTSYTLKIFMRIKLYKIGEIGKMGLVYSCV